MKSPNDRDQLLTEFQQQLANFEAENSVERWCVALSGGLDSVVLLHLLHLSQSSRPIRAIHVNHGISLQAAKWQSFCERLCQALNIPIIAERVSVSDQGSLEENARKARYQVFEQNIAQGDVLLMAHHLNDQAETFFQRLIRGASISGLAAIPIERSLASGQLFRPLLGVSRSVLHEYALLLGVDWVEDESNESLQYDRNFLRHKILPELIGRWPGLLSTVRRTTELLRKDSDSLNYYRSQWIGQNGQGNWLDIASLMSLPNYEQLGVLSHWVTTLAGESLSSKQLQVLWSEVCLAKEDARSELAVGEHRFRRFRNRLYYSQAAEVFDPGVRLKLDTSSDNKEYELPSGDQVSLEAQLGGFVLPEGLVEIRYRQGGERFKPVHEAHHRELKKWLQTQDIPPWERGRIPLLYCNDKLVSVGDYSFDQAFAAKPDAYGWKLVWNRKKA
ncbi:tRNA lysidine(34) synthetase TilS [Litoribacillus peritrichatus]|uniref:tRNA(Ile)-lysidine synthase n=1 Tax=Litoribacillus peritrichatus TaxID=718191 RepID=A0ABP7N9E6_9GAMM